MKKGRPRKLSNEQAMGICLLHVMGYSKELIAVLYGVSYSTVRDVINGKWKPAY